MHDGVAEAIPLADASVDAVTVGHAFHWFDRSRALAEIRRVLRPGGGLRCSRWFPTGEARAGRTSWAHELRTLLIQTLRPEHPHFARGVSAHSDGFWSS